MAYKQILFFFLLFNLTSFTLFGQDPQLPEDLHQLARVYLGEHQYIQAELILNKALSIPSVWKEENKDLLKIILKDLALIYASTGRMESVQRLEIQIKMLED